MTISSDASLVCIGHQRTHHLNENQDPNVAGAQSAFENSGPASLSFCFEDKASVPNFAVLHAV